MTGDDRASGKHRLDPKHLAELAPRAEHELDLALAEAQGLQCPGECDSRRRMERVARIRRTRGRGRHLTDVERLARGEQLGPAGQRIQRGWRLKGWRLE